MGSGTIDWIQHYKAVELLSKANITRRSRRKFLTIGTTATGSLLLVIAGFFRLDSKKSKSARFLTQGGKLVDVDLGQLPWQRTVATREQLINWVHRKKKPSA